MIYIYIVLECSKAHISDDDERRKLIKHVEMHATNCFDLMGLQ